MTDEGWFGGGTDTAPLPIWQKWTQFPAPLATAAAVSMVLRRRHHATVDT